MIRTLSFAFLTLSSALATAQVTYYQGSARQQHNDAGPGFTADTSTNYNLVLSQYNFFKCVGDTLAGAQWGLLWQNIVDPENGWYYTESVNVYINAGKAFTQYNDYYTIDGNYPGNPNNGKHIIWSNGFYSRTVTSLVTNDITYQITP